VSGQGNEEGDVVEASNNRLKSFLGDFVRLDNLVSVVCPGNEFVMQEGD
jgi:hypothetical protein